MRYTPMITASSLEMTTTVVDHVDIDEDLPRDEDLTTDTIQVLPPILFQALYNERRQRQRKACKVGGALVVGLLVMGVIGVFFSSFTTSTDDPGNGGLGSSSSSSVQSSSSNNNHNNRRELLLCDPKIECKTDRWPYNERLTVGQSLCNEEWRFGVVTIEQVGSLLWQDCRMEQTIFLQNITLTDTDNGSGSSNDDEEDGTLGSNNAGLSFAMNDHGKFQLYKDHNDDNNPIWELESIYTYRIEPHKECLKDHPIMDCPYIHLQKHGGHMMLNYIEDDHSWQTEKVHKSYPNLFPHNFGN